LADEVEVLLAFSQANTEGDFVSIPLAMSNEDFLIC
jgi:hypothetical protein